MKELMLRLIKDGKIAGFLFYCGGMEIVYSEDGTDWYPEFIPHDSFNMGIEVGGEWLFAGDIVEREHDSWGSVINIIKVKATGILKYQTHNYDQGWIIERLTGEEWAFNSPECSEWTWDGLKRIGNIYEEGK